MEARLTAIDRGQVLQYLGFRGGELPPELEDSLRRCEAQLLETAHPRVLWKLFPLLPDGSLAGSCFRPEGRDIRAFLRDCGELILMAATLGAEVAHCLTSLKVALSGKSVSLILKRSNALWQIQSCLLFSR